MAFISAVRLVGVIGRTHRYMGMVESGFNAAQDEASRSKVGLTAGKMELDARLYIADILGPALAANHKLGLATGLLQVRTSMPAHCSWVL